MDELKFTLTPVDEKKKKEHVKSRSDIRKDLGYNTRYRPKRSKRK